MKDSERQWLPLCARQHGVASRRQGKSVGLSDRQLEGRVADGSLVAVRRGVYRQAAAPESFEQRVMAACLAARAVASHRCAAALWGLRGCEPSPVEVTVTARRRAELAGVISHTTRRLDRVDRAERQSIPLTSPARTLLDLGAVAPSHVVESALEDALHRRLVTRSWLERTLERSGSPRRDGTGVLRALLLERDPEAAATESTLEDALVRLLRRAGAPAPVRQHWVSVPGHGPVGSTWRTPVPVWPSRPRASAGTRRAIGCSGTATSRTCWCGWDGGCWCSRGPMSTTGPDQSSRRCCGN